jgi:mRNA-degrading endonuclease RelE of RelBE toxin-antitoxin system
MAWTALTVEWHRQAQRDIRRLSAKDAAQIVAAVDAYAATGRGDIRQLQGQDGYRFRVRDRRVFVTIVWVDHRLVVTAVSTRGDAY